MLASFSGAGAALAILGVAFWLARGNPDVTQELYADAPPAPPESEMDASRPQVALSRSLARELEVLKVRNRLTHLGDRAIALGDRRSYDQLRVALDAPSYRDYRIALRAEIIRVENAYATGGRLGTYVLPVRDLFPGRSWQSEGEVATAELIALLGDYDRPWEVRTRAAYLLGTRQSRAANEALVGAILEDPNLEVLRESMLSLEENAGFRAPHLFDTGAVAEWWENNQ
ncbi:hypothetical protein BH23VER1_BH23VER1_27690 [soil metagenome]